MLSLSKVTYTIHPKMNVKEKSLRLTSIIVQCCKLGALVATAGAVTGFHLQLVPGGLTQLCQEHICGGVGAYILPRPCTCKFTYKR